MNTSIPDSDEPRHVRGFAFADFGIPEPGNNRWRIAGASFCLLMLGIHIAAGLNCTGIPDFWRDMYWATSIAYGERFPLSGPPIYHLIELGPWWYYLLAVPIRMTHGIAAAAVLVQVLAAAKYVLAWHVGTRFVDARFGVAFCVSLAIAGWSTAPLIFPSHTALVETTILLLVLATARCWKGVSIGNAVLFGLASAACLHAHPSTVTYVLLVSAMLLSRHRSYGTLVLLCLSAGVVLLSLAPPWFDQDVVAVGGFGGRKSIAMYVDHDLGSNFWLRVPRMLEALCIGGPWSGFMLLTSWKMKWIWIAFGIYCFCLAFAVCGLLFLQPERHWLRRWFAYALLLVLVQAIVLTFVRVSTPIWMTQSCLLPLALAIAIGWYGWFTAGARAWRVTGITAFFAYGALALAPFGFFLRHAHSVRVMPHSNPFADISNGENEYRTVPAPFIPARKLDELSRNLCAPIVLHARLGWAIEHALASPVRNACGYWPALHYAGLGNGARHIAGIAARAVSAIGIPPDRLIAGMAWYENVRAIAPTRGQSLTKLARMQVMPDAVYIKPSQLVYEFESRDRDVVSLTNRFGEIAPMDIQSVSVNGQSAKMLFDEGNSLLYACASCSSAKTVHWRIELDGIDENLDLVVIPASNDRNAGALEPAVSNQ